MKMRFFRDYWPEFLLAAAVLLLAFGLILLTVSVPHASAGPE